MKIVAYTPLLYGREYMASAVRSVLPFIDEWHVLYTPHGSYTERGGLCPETREELHAIAITAAGNKLHWHEGRWGNEGAHRNAIATYAPDADVLLALDADEIWGEDLIEYIMQVIHDPKQYSGLPRNIRLPMIHYWRSFYQAVLHDPAFPTRVVITSRKGGEMQLGDVMPRVAINHMGYAQTPEIVGYKMTVHGHLNEIRPMWFEDIYLDKNRRTDLHPAGSQYWNVEPVDWREWMPAWMAEHPFANMPIIE